MSATDKNPPHPNDIICACKRIRYSDFKNAVLANQAFTLGEARKASGANVSCGLCYEIVETLLKDIEADTKG